MNYRFQFITLAGWHMVNLSAFELARAYRSEGMTAYVRIQDREFALEEQGYTAAKHGVVGLMRSYANYLAPHSIRVNTVHPTGVNTPMVVNDAIQAVMQADPSMGAAMANAMPVDMVEPVDISNAILWLVSDAARYVTGVTLPVDAGFTNKK